MEDVVDTLNLVFPVQVGIPQDLQTDPGCLADSSQKSCLLKCSDPPVSFEGWRDTFAYGLCSTSMSLCVSLSTLIGNFDSLGGKLSVRAAFLEETRGMDMGAYNFCFGVTFVNLIPVIILIVAGISTALLLLYLPCVFLPKLISLVAQSWVHLHSE